MGGFPCCGFFDKVSRIAASCGNVLTQASKFPPFVHNVILNGPFPSCQLNIRFRLKNGTGWAIVNHEKHFPNHSPGCYQAPVSRGAVIRKAVEDGGAFKETGQNSMPISLLKKAVGLNNVASTTVTYHVNQVKAKEFDEPREESEAMLLPLLSRISADNATSLVVIQTQHRDGTMSYHQLKQGNLSLEGNEFHQMYMRQLIASTSGTAQPMQGKLRTLLQKLEALQRRRDTLFSQQMHSQADLLIHQIDATSEELNQMLQTLDYDDIQKEICQLDEILKVEEGKAEQARDGDFVWEGCHFRGGTVVNISVVFGPVVNLVKTSGKRFFCFDGTHMKDGVARAGGKGQMLIVEAEDALGHIYPLAMSICFSESAQNYSVLFHALTRVRMDLDKPGYLLMSDRGRACLSVILRQFRRASHRLCCEHIIRNAQHKLGRSRKLTEEEKGLIRNYFRARNKQDLDSATEGIEQLPKTVSGYIEKIPKDSIVSMCFIDKGVPTYGRINSNNVESENSRQALSRKSKTLLETFFYFLTI